MKLIDEKAVRKLRWKVADWIDPDKFAYNQAINDVLALMKDLPNEKVERIHDPNKFRVGDTVKVIRKAKNYEGGWKNAWVTDMRVGLVSKIDYCSDFNNGYGLSDSYFYPSFSLELVKGAKR